MLKSIPFYASLLGKKIGDRITTTSHVLLYGAIEVHSFGSKGCIAGNDTLASETGIAKNQIRRYLADIRELRWVEYDLSKDNKRGVIKALLDINIPLVEKQPRVGRKATKPLVEKQPTSIDNSLDNSRGTSAEALEDEKPTCSVEDCRGKIVIVPLAVGEVELNKCERHRIQDIIDAFKSVNESYLELYGKKTQYDAAKQLMRTYPREHIHWMLKTAPSYNKMPYRAAGEKVYTPYDLLKNWSVMKDNLMSIKIKKATGIQPKEILG